MELSIDLLKPNGFLGYITPNTFLKNIHSEPLRKFLLENTVIREIMLFQYSVFSSASVDVSISLFQKIDKVPYKNEIAITNSLTAFEVRLLRKINQSVFRKNNRLEFNVSVSESDNVIINKIIEKSKPLGTYGKAYFGIQTYDRKQFVSDNKENKNYQPIIDGGNILSLPSFRTY